MPRTNFILSACVAAAFLAPSIHAATDQDPSSLTAANCTLTMPTAWHPVDLSKQPGMVVAFADADGDRTLMVLTHKRGKPSDAINDTYAAGFDKGVENSGGGKKTAGKFTKVAGFDAYERRGTVTVKGRNLTTLGLAIPTGDGTYLIESLSAQGEAGDDPEIRQAVDSFHFLRPPGPPRRAPDAAYRTGYLAGQSFAGLSFLGLIIWGISKAFSRRPPPSPAGFSGPYPYPQGGFPPAANLPPPLPAASPAPLVAPPAQPPDLY